MQLHRILFSLLAAAALYACATNENGEPSVNTPEEDFQQRNIGPDGGDFTFALTSVFSPSCEITRGKEWIVPASKASEYEFLFKILPNETTEPRQGEIVFSTKTHIWRVEINQDKASPVLFAKTDSPAVFSSEASSLEVTVICNVPVSLAISEGCDWIRVLGEPVKQESITYSFSIAENTDTTPREAVISFSNEACSLSSEIKVTQAAKDVFIVSGRYSEVPGVYGFGEENWMLRDGKDVLCNSFRDGRRDQTFIDHSAGVFFSAAGIDININDGDEADIEIIQNFTEEMPLRSTRKFHVTGVTKELVYLKDSEGNGLILKK